MDAKLEGAFLEKMCAYVVSLPFDLDVLQEAVADPDFELAARELAAGTIVHTMLPQEGEPGPLRYVDDALLVRAALAKVVTPTSDAATAFRARFSEIYEKLDDDVRLFEDCLGELWPWLTGKLPSFPKLAYKGKKPAQCVEDEETAAFLYEAGQEFKTNYTVTEAQVQNKLRRADQIVEVLQKRRAEELKKRA